ncbi:MAG: dTDP-4-dehydrorhamnose 3,5-epimerase, partial [Bacteroidetes bacterium]|nr:dTDP-4-dehydrorhamnose 3,5-epimerase [Bacteroidota bacterium]
RLGIDWPVEAPTLSAKDAAAPTLNAVPASDLPLYDAAQARSE